MGVEHLGGIRRNEKISIRRQKHVAQGANRGMIPRFVYRGILFGNVREIPDKKGD